MKNNNETRLALLEQSIGHVNETMLRMESRFDQLDKKIDDGFKQVNSRIWANFYWGVAAIAGSLAIMAHGFKWL